MGYLFKGKRNLSKGCKKPSLHLCAIIRMTVIVLTGGVILSLTRLDFPVLVTILTVLGSGVYSNSFLELFKLWDIAVIPYGKLRPFDSKMDLKKVF